MFFLNLPLNKTGWWPSFCHFATSGHILKFFFINLVWQNWKLNRLQEINIAKKIGEYPTIEHYISLGPFKCEIMCRHSVIIKYIMARIKIQFLWYVNTHFVCCLVHMNLAFIANRKIMTTRTSSYFPWFSVPSNTKSEFLWADLSGANHGWPMTLKIKGTILILPTIAFDE